MIHRTLIVTALFVSCSVAQAQNSASSSFQQQVAPVLKAHCAECHGGTKPEAKLDLTLAPTDERFRAQQAQWFRVLERIEDGSMPPADAKPLNAAQKQAVAKWVRGDFSQLFVAQQRQEGRSKVRRLTRTEYANTVQDLVRIRPPVSRELPVDGRVDGFDKVSAALPLSSAHASGYVKLAEEMMGRMLQPLPKTPQERTQRYYGGASEQSGGHILELENGTKVSFNTDTTSGPLRRRAPDGKVIGSAGTRYPGVHKLRLSVYGYQTDKPLPFGIYAGHTGAYPQLLTLLKVLEAPPGKSAVVETEVYFRTGLDNDLVPISDGFRLIPFGLGVQVPKNSQASACKGPGLAIEWVEVEEPELPLPGDRFLTADMTVEQREVFTRPGATLKNAKLPREEIVAVARKTLSRVGGRFFRRDLTDAELTAITDSFAAKLDAGAQRRLALIDELTALMTAPDFLCLVEQPGPLDNFSLASRLSYFLWNSAPDEELLAVARQGKLTDSKTLRDQTERLLRDKRSQRFVNDFIDQWLGLWGVDNTTPDKDLYPEYDDLLKMSSVMETQETFALMLRENRSVRDFVAPNWALVNHDLAKHYNFPPVSGFSLRSVSLPADTPFGGLWTQAATMKVTANGTLTSPVKRGVWVAERLLGITIPPPPANIDPVDPDTRGAKTLREQLALHSAKGSCAACHAKFDPYGFALESFDVMGNFRTAYRVVDPEVAKLPPQQRKGAKTWTDGLPVDCTGTTPDGKAFASMRELRAMLAANPAQLAHGVTRHLLTYATGTPTGPLERQQIEQIVQQTAPENYGLRSLVHGVVQSNVFRTK